MDSGLLAAEVSRLRWLLGMAAEALLSMNGSHDAGFVNALREAAGMAALEVPEPATLDVAMPRFGSKRPEAG